MDNIRIKPISVKYVSTSVGERKYEIWEFNPYTNEEGTLVPYDDAIKILTNIPNLVTICSTKVDGKVVSSVSEDVQNEIARKVQEKRMGIGTHISIPSDEPTHSSSALEAVIKSQATIIENQTSQMTELQKQMAEMQKQMAELLKKK